MFNLNGSEIIFLLLLALIILGPEKLPEAVRKFGKGYAEFKKVTTGFQQELKSALDEPMREMRDTADALKKAATFDLQPDPNAPKLPVASGAEPPRTPQSQPQPSSPPATASPQADELGSAAE